MKKSIRILALVLFIVSALLCVTGCTININIGNLSNDTENETISNHEVDNSTGTNTYQSRATIYVSNKNAAGSTAISSSDLAISKQFIETYAVILDSDQIHNEIRKKYPEEYTLSIESINGTGTVAIVVASENPENLEEICNMATSLFCEFAPQIMGGITFKIVSLAKTATLVGTN